MGRALALAGEAPDLVVTSSAVRARTTIELAAAAGNWQCPVRITEDLYGASPGQVIGIAQGVDDGVERLLFAGHEPTWSMTASILIGGGEISVKTATAVAIDFLPVRWADAAPGRGSLAWMLTPRLFTDGTFDLG
jgi:phosphohistidine phosphatase